MIKRIVVASFVTIVTAVGVAAPAADAAPKHHHGDSGSVSILIDWE